MAGKVIIGAQWGDEGKGKFIDIFSSQADMVVRSQGGNNAGHTVIVGDEVYKLQLIPSGILYPKTINVIAPGVVCDPKAILGEMAGLLKRKVSLSNLFIDERVHIVMPWHLILDGLYETARGSDDIGTTKKGIGPCYMDKCERIGIRMHEFINPEVFAERVRSVGAKKNDIIVKLYGGEPLDLEAIIKEYAVYAEKIKPFVHDTSYMVYEAIKQDKKVLFEGAQGTLLDLDMGTYPFVTSSHPVSAGACIGSGIGPTLIKEVVGVFKGYTTRVGKGPFPTELEDEIGDYIREKGGEFGTVTGRPRRTGWFDTVICRYSVRVNGLTSIIVNKIDPMRGLDKIKLCVAYEVDGNRINEFPATLEELAKCKPIYEEFDGFSQDISQIRDYNRLPDSIKAFIARIEELCGCTVSIVGVGPARDQIIYKNS